MFLFKRKKREEDSAEPTAQGPSTNTGDETTPFLAGPSSRKDSTSRHPHSAPPFLYRSDSFPGSTSSWSTISGSPFSPTSPPNDQNEDSTAVAPPTLSRALLIRLYTSHFFSTWNTRVFEFGAVLYLASIFPSTLLPMSVYALVRGIAAVTLSPAIGRAIDDLPRRGIVRASIVFQRLAVAGSCVGFWWMLRRKKEGEGALDPGNAVVALVMASLALLACVEKLAAVANLVAVERDWVVVIAQGDEAALRSLNSQMRRIDLICKLCGPFVISILDGVSTETAIIFNFALNTASIAVEYFAIDRVYHLVPALQTPKHQPNTPHTRRRLISTLTSSLHIYFNHPALLPSLTCATLYFTVLSFGGQMVTFLLTRGFTPLDIGILRTFSVGIEISATWLAPLVMARIGAVRAGMWFVSWELALLAAGVAAFVYLPSTSPSASPSLPSITTSSANIPRLFSHLLSPTGILTLSTTLSRLGLWGFDLSTQVIIQTEVSGSQRGAFSAIEQALQAGFELCAYGATVAFSRPDEFVFPVLMSVGAVLGASAGYAGFVRRRRGHLLHLERLGGCAGCGVEKGRERGRDEEGV